MYSLYSLRGFGTEVASLRSFVGLHVDGVQLSRVEPGRKRAFLCPRLGDGAALSATCMVLVVVLRQRLAAPGVRAGTKRGSNPVAMIRYRN